MILKNRFLGISGTRVHMYRRESVVRVFDVCRDGARRDDQWPNALRTSSIIGGHIIKVLLACLGLSSAAGAIIAFVSSNSDTVFPRSTGFS